MGGMMDGGHMPFSAPPFGRGRPMPDSGPLLMGMPPFGPPFPGEPPCHPALRTCPLLLPLAQELLGAWQAIRGLAWLCRGHKVNLHAKCGKAHVSCAMCAYVGGMRPPMPMGLPPDKARMGDGSGLAFGFDSLGEAAIPAASVFFFYILGNFNLKL